MPKASLLFVTVGNIATAAAQWYLVWLFARQDGPAAVGQYSTLIAALTPVFILSQLGLRNLYLTLQARVRWGVYLGVRICSAALAAGIGLLVLGLVVSELSWPMAAAVLVIKLCDTIADLFFARLQRAERLRAFGLILIGSAVVTAVTVTLVMAVTGSVVSALWGVAGTALLVAVVTAVLGQRAPAPERAADFGPPADATSTGTEVRTLLTAGLPLSLMQGIYSLTSYAPLGVVALFGAADDVGRYASAAYLVVFANLVGASVETVMLPVYRRLHEDPAAPPLVRTSLVRGGIIMAALSPLIIVALVLGSPLLVAVYGEAFALSAPAIGMLALAAVITVPTYLLSATLLVLNRYWATTFVGAFSVAVALLSGGIAGAAGMPAVEAGCLALLCGSVGRYAGELVLAWRPARPARRLDPVADPVPSQGGSR